ncbi:MAG: hypothetical protein ACRDL2_01000 [Gaiellaceae bacterium]
MSALESEVRRQMMGPLRLRRQVFSPRREFKRIARRCARVGADPTFELGLWESHKPVLVGLLQQLRDPRVLELGMGYASTPVVLALSRSSVSIETDEPWFARFSRFASERHEFVLLTDYTQWEWCAPYLDEQWDVVFLDNAPYSTRQSNLVKLADKARFIVCHDTEECFKPAGSDYRWDFSSFEHVWTFTRFDNYTTVVSNAEPIPLEHLPGIAGRPPRRQ